jgi:hypothetical protein
VDPLDVLTVVIIAIVFVELLFGVAVLFGWILKPRDGAGP